MYILIVVIHVIVCLILVGVVLLQAGKGAEMGAAFGGSSQTIFGSRGATTFLSKLTVAAAVIFMVTSLSLSILSRERPIVSTVIDQVTKDNAQDETAAPASEEGAAETPAASEGNSASE